MTMKRRMVVRKPLAMMNSKVRPGSRNNPLRKRRKLMWIWRSC
jgi:hypothetical protein